MTESYERAVTNAGAAARILYDAGARRVWLVGSLAHGNHWDSLSDYDFATIGLPESLRNETAARLTRRLERHVDVILLEDAPSFIRTQILLEMLTVHVDGSVARRSGPPPPYPVATIGGPTHPRGLHRQRHAVTADVLHRREVRKALDIGCAEGGFELAAVKRRPQGPTQFHGIDPDGTAVAAGTDCLDRELEAPLRRRARLDVAGIPELPAVWSDHDAVVAIEVIEHLDPPMLDQFANHVFEHLAPRTVVLTTPNAEYNAVFTDRAAPRGAIMRHPDHRFEWTRDEMRRWLVARAAPAGYHCALRGIGEAHPEHGSPTQMWVLTRDQ